MSRCTGTVTLFHRNASALIDERFAQRSGSEKATVCAATERTSVEGTVHKDGTLHVRVTRDGHTLLHLHIETPEHNWTGTVERVECTLDGALPDAMEPIEVPPYHTTISLPIDHDR